MLTSSTGHSQISESSSEDEGEWFNEDAASVTSGSVHGDLPGSTRSEEEESEEDYGPPQRGIPLDTPAQDWGMSPIHLQPALYR